MYFQFDTKCTYHFMIHQLDSNSLTAKYKTATRYEKDIYTPAVFFRTTGLVKAIRLE